MSELGSVLESVGQAASVIGGTLPGPAGIAARVIGLTLSAAAAFARAGKDPEFEIRRIHAAEPLLVGVHDEWKRKLDERFPQSTPPPPDTQPGATYDDGGETLATAYSEQLEDIGEILVRASVLTREEIARQGVRFALRDHFEPRAESAHKRASEEP